MWLFADSFCILWLYSPRILRAAEWEAAVIAAVPAEGIVAAPELAGDLLISGPAPGHKHDVEPGEAADGEEDQGYDAHDDHRHDRCHLENQNRMSDQ